MKILVACEESQAVTIELRRLGHEAYSCDIEPCSGGHPEWHIRQDVLPLLDGDCEFDTVDGAHHVIVGEWDMLIAFPPCTDLAVSGAAWFEQKRKDGRQQRSIEFFMRFAKADCNKIVIENPVGIMSSHYRKPDQIIQPYMFGHPESKKTCLWLKNLTMLKPTNVLKIPESGRWNNQTVDGQNKIVVDGVWIGFNDPRTAKLRSKTYRGIAVAMAEQWAGDAHDAT